MRFSPLSFLLGLGAATVLPIVSRAFRPFLVEAAALGMIVTEEVRRVAAEQIENLEDIVAEARMKREGLAAAAAAAAGLYAEGEEEPVKSESESPIGHSSDGRARGRTAGRVRTPTS